MKSLLIGVAAIVVLVLPLYANGSKESASSAASTSGPKTVQITMWTHDYNYAKFFGQEAKIWAKKYPNDAITFKPQVFPSGAAFWNKELTTMVSGQKLPDLLDLEIGHFSQFMKPNVLPKYVVNLTPLLGSRISDFTKLNAYTYQGKVYALESALSPNGYYYQPQIFKKYGISESIANWQQFAAEGRKLAQHGVAMAPLALDNGSNTFLNLLYEAGGAEYDAHGNLTIDSPIAVTVLTYLKEAVDAGVFKTLSSSDFWGTAVYQLYKKGTVAGVVAPDWYNTAELQASLPGMKGQWRLMPMPRWTGSKYKASTWGGTGFGVAKNNANAKMAANLLLFAYATKAGQLARTKAIGYFPNEISAMQDPKLLNESWPYFGGQQINRIWASEGQNVAPFYQNANIAQLNQFLNSALDSVYTGKAEPAAALKNVVTQMKNAANF